MENKSIKDFNEDLITNKENIENIPDDFRNFQINYDSMTANDIRKQRNQITTSKYNYFNFIFKILFEQFSQPANMYFLILGIMSVSIFIN